MTEEEAKTKWCPMSRCADPENSAINKPYFEDIDNQCMASACMMWRCEVNSFNHGYCGLGGKP